MGGGRLFMDLTGKTSPGFNTFPSFLPAPSLSKVYSFQLYHIFNMLRSF